MSEQSELKHKIKHIDNLNEIPNGENQINEKIFTFKKSRTSYLGKITQNINKINYYITQNDKLPDINLFLHKLQNICTKLKMYPVIY